MPNEMGCPMRARRAPHFVNDNLGAGPPKEMNNHLGMNNYLYAAGAA